MKSIHVVRFWFLLFSMLLFSTSVAGSTLKIHRIDPSKFPNIKALVSIERDGVIIDPTLSSDYKAAISGGKTVAISRVATLKNTAENVAVLLAVDTSGSMKQEHLTAIKKAIKKLINDKNKGDMAALISFNDDVTVNCEFTKDADYFLTKLDALKTGGKITVLFKALYQGLEMLEKPDIPKLRYMVILSDGKDEGVGFKLDDAIQKAKQLHIPVYAIGFVSKAETIYLDNMIRLARLTDAEYHRIQKTEDFMTAYSSIADKIWKQQLIELQAGFEGDGQEYYLEIQYTMPDGSLCSGRMAFVAPSLPSVQTTIAPVTTTLSPPPTTTIPADHKGDSGTPKKKTPNLYIYGGIALIALISAVILFLLLKRKKSIKPVPLETQEPFKTGSRSKWREEPIGPSSDSSMMDQAIENPLILVIPSLRKEYPLTPGTITIGAYPDNSVVLDQDIVSGYHAEISGNGKEWILKDLGSTNGTRLNGELISDPVYIYEGDIIRIGRADIEVRKG